MYTHLDLHYTRIIAPLNTCVTWVPVNVDFRINARCDKTTQVFSAIFSPYFKALTTAYIVEHFSILVIGKL